MYPVRGVKDCARNGALARLFFVWKKTCSTCRDARSFLQRRAGARPIEERELNANPFSAAELDALIGARDHIAFLNTRNERYRELKLKDHPPSRKEALKLMAETPNLIRRPLLFSGDDVVFGFDEAAFTRALGK